MSTRKAGEDVHDPTEMWQRWGGDKQVVCCRDGSKNRELDFEEKREKRRSVGSLSASLNKVACGNPKILI